MCLEPNDVIEGVMVGPVDVADLMGIAYHDGIRDDSAQGFYGSFVWGHSAG